MTTERRPAQESSMLLEVSSSQLLVESPETSLSLHSSPSTLGEPSREMPALIPQTEIQNHKERLPVLSRFVQLRANKLPKVFELVRICPVYEDQVDLHEFWPQDTTCMSSYCKPLLNDSIGQCAACASRNATSGGCRFQHLRRILKNLRKPERFHVLVNDPKTTDLIRSIYRPPFSVAGTSHDADFLLRTIKVSLQAILDREQRHDKLPHILRRPRDEYTRNICDGCATTIFSSHFICYVCARELCLECFDEWDESIDAVEQFLHLNRCTTRKGQVRQLHTKLQMLPSTRFGSNDLSLLQYRLASVQNGQLNDEQMQSQEDTIPCCDTSEGIPYAAAQLQDVTLARFQKHWASGQPLRLSGFERRFSINWTPDYFIEKFGDQRTELIDVISRAVQPSTIRDFFQGLSLGEAKTMKHLKLNDWPVVDDFAIAMPDLFEDFEQALPFPIYTRRKGFLNLASWFPPQYLPPDLGPKLYCAGASSDEAGEKGTTVLHMDMTDAINIMTWAGEKPDSRPGCAVWDVFNQNDSNAIRSYLLERLQQDNPNVIMDDPIRRAQFYLDKQDLSRLAERGVVSWRIYQNPGDAVFIPAGCAHQVCNLTPCIKVACDFVCPENIARCAAITQADRKLAIHAKREDVLQLQNIIYFAFLGVQEWLHPSPAAIVPQGIVQETNTEQNNHVRPLKRKSTSAVHTGERRRTARECKTRVISYLEEFDREPVETGINDAGDLWSNRPMQDTDLSHGKGQDVDVSPYKARTSRRKVKLEPTFLEKEQDNYSANQSSPEHHSGTVTILHLRKKEKPGELYSREISAEDAFKSFIETYGYTKLTELFIAHQPKDAKETITLQP